VCRPPEATCLLYARAAGPLDLVTAWLTPPTQHASQDKDNGQLVTFCTGVRAADTLMPMWCGTDYDNEKSRSCSSYFNMLYEVGRRRSTGGTGAQGPCGAPAAAQLAAVALHAACYRAQPPEPVPRDAVPSVLSGSWCPPISPQYVKVGIADPTINWVDLGASRRSAKTAIGFTGYPVRWDPGGGGVHLREGVHRLREEGSAPPSSRQSSRPPHTEGDKAAAAVGPIATPRLFGPGQNPSGTPQTSTVLPDAKRARSTHQPLPPRRCFAASTSAARTACRRPSTPK
jgi:hypothetical protein